MKSISTFLMFVGDQGGKAEEAIELYTSYMVRPGLQEQFVEMEEVATAIYPTCLRGFFALWP